jgi:hypothetical protein
MNTRPRILAAVPLALFALVLGGDWSQAQQNVAQTLRTATIDAREANSTFASFVRIRDTTEEFILDFGTNDEAPAAPTRPIKIDQRIVLSPYTAKRLLIALEVTLGAHERSFGVIETDPLKRVKQ